LIAHNQPQEVPTEKDAFCGIFAPIFRESKLKSSGWLKNSDKKQEHKAGKEYECN
jgi:hypothetical protein